MDLKLYNYFRSSASYRVRIALHYKNLEFEYLPIHLLLDGGEQHKPQYINLNPHSQVPCLVAEGAAISQSVAIMEYLDEAYPEPRLYPTNSYKKAKVRELCEVINSGMQPFINLSTLQYLTKSVGLSEEQKVDWITHFLSKGFTSLESIIKKTSGRFSCGDEVTAADLFLVPQIFAAQRYPFDISAYPTLQRINETCEGLEAFVKAHPYRQPDTPQELAI